MPYTIWSTQGLLGYSELESPAVSPGARTGVFHPTAAFGPVWPILRAFHELTAQLVVNMGAFPPGASGEEIYHGLMARPEGAAMAESARAMAALRLELHDPAGVPLPDCNIMISERLSPTLLAVAAATLGAEAARELARDLGQEGSAYMVAAAPRRRQSGVGR